MKKRAIESLWCGEISPWEDQERDSGRIHRLARIIDERERQLVEVLDEDGQRRFKEYRDANVELGGIVNENSFEKGFALGVRLIAEVLIV